MLTGDSLLFLLVLSTTPITATVKPEARRPMIAITISISISVKPRRSGRQGMFWFIDRIPIQSER